MTTFGATLKRARLAADPPAGFRRPFRHDGHNYIYDAFNRMCADFMGPASLWEGSEFTPDLRARGWGRIQSDPKMDEWRAWLFAKADGSSDPETVVQRLNNTGEAA